LIAWSPNSAGHLVGAFGSFCSLFCYHTAKQEADRDARQCSLPQSQVVRRAVWTKTLKGKSLVWKLVSWQTHKEMPLVAGAKGEYPAYFVACTDYSPDRAEPLLRDIRVSNNHAQIEQLRNELAKEKIVKGWTLDSNSVAA
jgi:hypothetical protein